MTRAGIPTLWAVSTIFAFRCCRCLCKILNRWPCLKLLLEETTPSSAHNLTESPARLLVYVSCLLLFQNPSSILLIFVVVSNNTSCPADSGTSVLAGPKDQVKQLNEMVLHFVNRLSSIVFTLTSPYFGLKHAARSSRHHSWRGHLQKLLCYRHSSRCRVYSEWKHLQSYGW